MYKYLEVPPFRVAGLCMNRTTSPHVAKTGVLEYVPGNVLFLRTHGLM